MEKEIQELRNEVLELREAMRLLTAITTSVVATSADSAEATKALREALRDAEQLRPRSNTFWEFAAGTLRMLSSAALRRHPDDPELQEIHDGVRQAPH